MSKTIARIAVLMVAAGSLELGVVVPAQAQSGFLCGFASITDPTAGGGVQVGEMDGGPLLAADGDNPGEETANISIRCTIQVGWPNSTHAGSDAASRRSLTNSGVAVLPPTEIRYVAYPNDPIWLCTEATVNGQTRYFDETENDFTRGWSTSSSATCSLAIDQDSQDYVAGLVDSVICPVFPAGLVLADRTIWDCTP